MVSTNPEYDFNKPNKQITVHTTSYYEDTKPTVAEKRRKSKELLQQFLRKRK